MKLVTVLKSKLGTAGAVAFTVFCAALMAAGIWALATGRATP